MTPTDAEAASLFGTVATSAGTYEVSGSTFVRRPLVARNPGQVGIEGRAEFSLTGDELTVQGSPFGQSHLVYRKVS